MSNCSPEKIEANRRNALKSTGPRTAEGKAISAKNALTHGFCAVKIDVPAEDGTVLDAREDAWLAELNPRGGAAGAYVVGLAVRASGRLDRLHAVHTARVARLARDAIKVRTEARMRDVERHDRMLFVHPDRAARRLRLTSEGCAHLIVRWKNVALCLAPPVVHWDNGDHAIALSLLGQLDRKPYKRPSRLTLPTKAIMEHREVVDKLKLNEHTWISYHLKYTSEQEHQFDRENVEFLGDKAENARAFLQKLVDDNVAELTALKAKHDADDAAHDAELEFESRFDGSDEGKLIHRYEVETQRTLFRCLKEVATLNKVATQPVIRQDIISETMAQPPSPRPVAPARNEPTVRPDSGARPTAPAPRIGDDACRDMYMTLPPGPTQRR